MRSYLIHVNWLLLALISGACLFAGSASAQTYKWKDADGKIHYSDQPPPANAKEPVTVKPRKQAGGATTAAPANAAPPTAEKAAPAAKAKTYVEQEAEFRKRQVEAAERDAADKQKAVEAAQKKQNCDQARAQVSNLQAGGRVTRTNAQGEREYMTDAQIAQEVERAKKAANDWCK